MLVSSFAATAQRSTPSLSSSPASLHTTMSTYTATNHVSSFSTTIIPSKSFVSQTVTTTGKTREFSHKKPPYKVATMAKLMISYCSFADAMPQTVAIRYINASQIGGLPAISLVTVAHPLENVPRFRNILHIIKHGHWNLGSRDSLDFSVLTRVSNKLQKMILFK